MIYLSIELDSGLKNSTINSPCYTHQMLTLLIIVLHDLDRLPDLLDGDNQPVDIPIDPLTVEEITACLKWIRKSIRLWTKEGGRQGYLNYISQFIL